MMKLPFLLLSLLAASYVSLGSALELSELDDAPRSLRVAARDLKGSKSTKGSKAPKGAKKSKAPKGKGGRGTSTGRKKPRAPTPPAPAMTGNKKVRSLIEETDAGLYEEPLVDHHRQLKSGSSSKGTKGSKAPKGAKKSKAPKGKGGRDTSSERQKPPPPTPPAPAMMGKKKVRSLQEMEEENDYEFKRDLKSGSGSKSTKGSKAPKGAKKSKAPKGKGGRDTSSERKKPPAPTPAQAMMGNKKVRSLVEETDADLFEEPLAEHHRQLKSGSSSKGTKGSKAPKGAKKSKAPKGKGGRDKNSGREKPPAPTSSGTMK